ncbi:MULTISPECIES: MATE family efflux transporter [unclassified Facklamia]|uniref:MATE family efflux transporter n=1 Tax=Aerococcaceae TaxID=186827 RepID=UPI0013BE75A7|nr:MULTISPECIES: MATE family efflux transporter [unclassified Facklamia]MBS4461314.1 MATE family efflux transporter [Aerococcaceae bacterium zg-B36]NEW64203.1 MATE family efflux transporter [Facklamia sp. 252]NEW68290.1 MATE family efflux transporter [Facklamia sp. 253]QQD65910.1 MATE family efflux transporter [Aerococcaceae bacterium zg-252]
MKQTKPNLMLEGPITKTILTISAPLMLNNLIRTLYNLTDGLYVAQLSSDDFAATAFVWPLNFLFISLGMGIGVGATTLIAQNLGAKKEQQAHQYAQNALNLSIVIGLIFSVIGYFASPLFVQWMGGAGEFATKSITYLKINFIGLFFDFGYFAYQAVLNAEGQTKMITAISTISSLLNVILDPLLIFKTIPLINVPGLDMGIAGAAWATVISKIVLLILAAYTVQNRSRIPRLTLNFHFNWASIHTLSKIALPSAFGYGGAAMGFTVLNGLIQSYGTDTLAAFSMGNRLSDLMTQPQMGIGMALTSLIGQNVGAKQFDRAKAIFTKTLHIVLLISAVSSLAIFLFKDPLLSIFITDSSNHNLWIQASEYLYFSAFIIFFMGLFSGFSGFFQGVGKTNYSMYMAIGRLWFLRLPFIWIFSHFTSLESTGIWIAMLLSNGLTVLFAYIAYRYYQWEEII